MIILRQKEYARRDYEGLSEEYQQRLKKRRDELAKNLRRERAIINEEVNNRFNDLQAAKDVVSGKKTLDNFYPHRRDNIEDYVHDLKSMKPSSVENSINNYRKRRYERNLEYYGKMSENASEFVREEAAENAKELAKRKAEQVAARNKMLKRGGIGLAIGGTALAAGYGVKKYRDKKKQQAVGNTPNAIIK